MYDNNQNLISASTAISTLNKIRDGLMTKKVNLVTFLEENINLSSSSIDFRKSEVNDYINKIDPICSKIDSVINSINSRVIEVNKEIELNNIKIKTAKIIEGTKYGGRTGGPISNTQPTNSQVEIKTYSGYGKLQQEKY